MKRIFSTPRRSARARQILLFAAMTAGARAAIAGLSYTNDTGSGTWNRTFNWLDSTTGNHRAPGTGDKVYIFSNASPTLSYDAPQDPNLAALYHTDSSTFNDYQGTLTVFNEYYYGGTLNIGSTVGNAPATHVVGSTTGDGTLEIGNASAHVSGGATLNVWGTMQIGDEQGGATFTHDGATVNVTGSAATLNVGWDGNNSTYDFAASGTPFATLKAGLIQVGSGDPSGNGGGTGTFNQGGGSVTAATLFVGFLNSGSYTLDARTLKVGTESVGLPANGYFTQNGGTQTISDLLTVEPQGNYTVTGGQLSAAQIVVLNAMDEWSSGSVSVTGISGGNDLLVAGNGRYTLDGSARLVASGNEGVGTDGTAGSASIVQFAAGTSNNVLGTLTVGTGGGPNHPTYELQNGALVAQNLSLQGGNLVQTGGTATVPGTLTIAANQMYDLQAGSLTAPIASLTAAGAKIHVGPAGTAHLIALDGDGILQVDAGSHALFDTPGGLNEIDATVNNAGNVALVAGSDIAFSGTVNNNAGGIFDIQIDSGMVGGGSGTFNNSGGTLQKSGGTGTSTFSGLTLTNSSTIDGQSGTLDLNVTGANSGAINSEAGATVKLGGTWALNAGSSFNGAGTTVAYGTLNVMGNVTAATDFQLASGGSLQGSGYTFTSTNLLELQDGSSMSSPSSSTPLTVTSTGSMNVTGSPSLSTVVLNANGPTNQTAGANPYPALAASTNTIINNNSTWTVADDSGITGDSSSIFNNNGNFLKTGGGGTSAVQIPFNNAGTVNVESGTMDLIRRTITSTML